MSSVFITRMIRYQKYFFEFSLFFILLYVFNNFFIYQNFFSFILNSPDVSVFNSLKSQILSNLKQNSFSFDFLYDIRLKGYLFLKINILIIYFLKFEFFTYLLQSFILINILYYTRKILHFFYPNILILDTYLIFIFLLIPSFLLIFLLQGKEILILYSNAVLTYNFLKFSDTNEINKKHLNLKVIFNYFSFTLALIIILYSKEYLLLLYLFFTVSVIAMTSVYSLFFNKKIVINYNYFVILIIIIFFYLLNYYQLLSYGCDIYDVDCIKQNNSILFFSNITSTDLVDIAYNWKHTFFIPNFIDNLLSDLSKLRIHMINYNLSLNANLVFGENYKPSSFYEFLTFIPINIYYSLFYPSLTFWINADSFFKILISYESLLITLSFSSFFVLYKNFSNKHFILIFFFMFFSYIHCYIAPNIGTYFRYRSVFLIFIILLGFINWMHILKNLFNFISDFFATNETVKLQIHTIKKHSTIVTISLIITIFLLILRDIFILSYAYSYSYVSHLFLILSFINILTFSLTNPIIDSIVNKKLVDLNFYVNKFIHLSIMFTFFIVIIALFFLYFNFDSNFYNYINVFSVSILIITIPFNAIFSSFLIKKNVPYLPYVIQLIVHIFIFPLFIYFKPDINNILFILALATLITSFVLFLYSLKFNYKISTLSFNRFSSFNILELAKNILNYFLLNSYLFLLIVFVFLYHSNLLLSTYISLKLILGLVTLFISLSTSIFSEHFNRSMDSVSVNFNLFYQLTINILLLLFIVIIIIIPFLLPILKIFLSTVDDEYIRILYNTIISSLILLPVLVCLNMINKLFSAANMIKDFIIINLLMIAVFIPSVLFGNFNHSILIFKLCITLFILNSILLLKIFGKSHMFIKINFVQILSIISIFLCYIIISFTLSYIYLLIILLLPMTIYYFFKLDAK